MQLNVRSPQSTKIKFLLLLVAFGIVIPTLIYTHSLVLQLQNKEREIVRLYAKSFEYIVKPSTSSTDYSFIFNELITTIDFPLILTSPAISAESLQIISWKNINIDSTWNEQQRTKFFHSLIKEMDETNSPIAVTFQDSVVLNMVHYGESTFITQLRWLPYFLLAIGSLFILIGYVSFSYIKKNEQSNIWVGMARETAHQLGTPLSSLMGWIELLQLQLPEEKKTQEVLGDMKHDIQRLNKIAERFSKIGSKPHLKEENLKEVIEKVILYFQKRIPQTGKSVDISISSDEKITVFINRELFEWVIENLIKNALDSMEEKKGAITFHIEKIKNYIIIDVSDTGKGIEQKFKKDIFRPGFSTKKRGWGLGLSLSKRIIEDYHKGKIFLKESTIGKGTIFRIRLHE